MAAFRYIGRNVPSVTGRKVPSVTGRKVIWPSRPYGPSGPASGPAAIWTQVRTQVVRTCVHMAVRTLSGFSRPYFLDKWKTMVEVIFKSLKMDVFSLPRSGGWVSGGTRAGI